MFIRVIALVTILCMLQVAQAAPPQKCHPELLPEMIARVSLKQFSTQFTAPVIANAAWTDLGTLRRAARAKDDNAIRTFLADREGAYDWISTQAAGQGIPVYLYVGRMIDCAIRLDVNKALYRHKSKGTANEFIQQAATGKLDSEWLVKSLRRNINEVRETRAKD